MVPLEISWGMWIAIGMMFLVLFVTGGYGATGRGDQGQKPDADTRPDSDIDARR